MRIKMSIPVFRKYLCLGSVKFNSSRHFCLKAGQQLLNVKKRGSVTCIGINRPEKRNCLNYDVVCGLLEVLNKFESDKLSNVAVLHGEKGNFCYGYDAVDLEKDVNMINKIEKSGLLNHFSKKPIVAAINGYATGVGFDLALWCDFRIVEETAVMGCYARQYGAPVTLESSKRLVTLLGLHRALDIVLTGRIVKAKEAFESGIATRIVACGTAIGQAINFGNSLSNMPQFSLKANRGALYLNSNKYSPQIKSLIRDEFQENYTSALKEIMDGTHFTKSGDVRNRSDSASS